MKRSSASRLLLFDVGNTHTHIGLADARGLRQQADIPTAHWSDGAAEVALRRFVGSAAVNAAALCSVVPWATPQVRQAVQRRWPVNLFELTAATVRGVGVDYPRPETIGPDRLANAVAARARFGAPVVVLDFGTAVTFDVVDRRGNYIGGIIAPGLAAMTDYLHEKTALLPRIRIRDTAAVIGRSTEEAMLIGAVHGYRGLVRELLAELKQALRARALPVVATGGYAALLAARLPEITAVRPGLTLEGLRLEWKNAQWARPTAT
jgi:type III pantothenate kinase